MKEDPMPPSRPPPTEASPRKVTAQLLRQAMQQPSIEMLTSTVIYVVRIQKMQRQWHARKLFRKIKIDFETRAIDKCLSVISRKLRREGRTKHIHLTAVLNRVHERIDGLRDEGMIYLTHKLFRHNKHRDAILHINLGENLFGDEHCKLLCDVLLQYSCPALQSLELAENAMEERGSVALARLLRAQPELTRLDVSRNPLTVTGAEALAAALVHCSKLRFLTVGMSKRITVDSTLADVSVDDTEGQLSEPMCIVLSAFLQHCGNQIATVRLHDCSLYMPDLKGETGLKALDLSRRKITSLDDGYLIGNMLARCFKTLPSLRLHTAGMSPVDLLSRSKLVLALDHLRVTDGVVIRTCLRRNEELEQIVLKRESSEKSAEKITVATINVGVTEVNLSGKQLGLPGLLMCGASLPRFAAMTSVDLSNNNDLPCDSEGSLMFAELLAEVIKESNVAFLDISSNKIGPAEGIKSVAAALADNESIYALNIANNDLNAEGAAILCDNLKDNEMLTHLDLSGNCISSSGAQALTLVCEDRKKSLKRTGQRQLRRFKSSLTSLNVSNSCGTAVEAAEDSRHRNEAKEEHNFAENVAYILAESISLTSLEASGNFLEGNGARELAKALRNNRRSVLAILHLRDNQLLKELEPSTMRHLVNNLTCLDVSDNDLTLGDLKPGRKGCYRFDFKTSMKGVIALSEALAKSDGLQDLRLSNTALGAQGTKHIVTASTAAKLTALDVSRNHLFPVGAHHLAAHLPMRIASLNIAHNKLGLAGARHIATLIRPGAFEV